MPADNKCSRCGMRLYIMRDERGEKVGLSYVYPWKRSRRRGCEGAWVQAPRVQGKGVWILHSGACQIAPAAK
jgi:hypothetical protein